MTCVHMADGDNMEILLGIIQALPFCVLMGHRGKFLNYDVFMFIKIVFILVNSAHPDEMPPYASLLVKKNNDKSWSLSLDC